MPFDMHTTANFPPFNDLEKIQVFFQKTSSFLKKPKF